MAGKTSSPQGNSANKRPGGPRGPGPTARPRGSGFVRGRTGPSRGGRGGDTRSGGGARRRGARVERQKPEFDQRIVSIRRVTRVVSGGRRFSFSVVMVLGDRNGRVGVGIGKASDTALAIDKATRHARKNLFSVPRTATHSIPHDTSAHYAASRVVIRPAPGRGLVAGSSVRSVLELAGVTDVSAKLLTRSKNKLNNARVAMEALKDLRRTS